MIDTFAILLSTVFVVYVVIRAYVANKREVWFRATPTATPEKTRPRGPLSTDRRP